MLTLGIDSSTQGTKAVVYDAAEGRVVASAAVNYGKDLPEFGSPDGFLPNADPRVRRANPAMWTKGLELVLARLRDGDAPMDEIAAVGGDAQQHATVYLAAGETLSADYEIVTEPWELDRAGSCIRIDASEVKGGGYMPDLLQTVYIIPARDGSRISAAHCTAESAEGFGRRVAYMMDTLAVVDRQDH